MIQNQSAVQRVLTGRYVSGCGQASGHTHTYAHLFGGRVFGTFNVRLDSGGIDKCRPVICDDEGRRFWAVLVNGHPAYAYRWEGSKLPHRMLELVSQEPLPAYLKEVRLRIEVLGVVVDPPEPTVTDTVYPEDEEYTDDYTEESDDE